MWAREVFLALGCNLLWLKLKLTERMPRFRNKNILPSYEVILLSEAIFENGDISLSGSACHVVGQLTFRLKGRRTRSV